MSRCRTCGGELERVRLASSSLGYCPACDVAVQVLVDVVPPPRREGEREYDRCSGDRVDA